MADDRNIFRETVVTEIDLVVLGYDVGFRFTVVCRAKIKHSYELDHAETEPSATTHEVTDTITVPLRASVSTMILFLLICSCTRMTSSVPFTTKYPPGARDTLPASPSHLELSRQHASIAVEHDGYPVAPHAFPPNDFVVTHKLDIHCNWCSVGRVSETAEE
jgi:hypothetical protein